LRARDRIGSHAHFKRVRQVRADTCHRLRSERLYAGILDRVEHRARNGLGWAVGDMDTVRVMPQPQRHAIGKPARLGDLIGRQRAARHRHAEIFPCLRRRICGKGKFDLGLMRQGPRRAGEHGLEGFQRRLRCHAAGLVVRALSGKTARMLRTKKGAVRKTGRRQPPLSATRVESLPPEEPLERALSKAPVVNV
jgi:hypothetical protein